MQESTTFNSAPLAHHVRARTRRREHSAQLNVGEGERIASLVGGGGLVAYGITRGTIGGLGLALMGGALIYRGATGHCACYEAMGVTTARARSQGPGDSVAAQHGAKVEESIMVLRPREEVYGFWRDLANLPRIMRHLESVRLTGEGRSHWVAKGPLGVPVEWDAEIVTDYENELIGWRSFGDSQVDTAGSVRFIPALDGRGTEVRVVLKYDPPAGKLGVAVSELLGESPAEQVREDLHHFKQRMESGALPMAQG